MDTDYLSRQSRKASCLVILDDDPTGSQTVVDIPLITRWQEEDVEWAFQQGTPGFFVLTNTRALPEVAAAARVREIVQTSLRVASRLGIRARFVSRGDSTLRGHFPLETDVIADALEEAGRPVDAVLLVPAYLEAGRSTSGATHYVDALSIRTPVSETEFARDATFGFRNSYLPLWVEEKTDGRVRADEVLTLPLSSVRGDPADLADVLFKQRDRRVVVPDVTGESDLRALTAAVEVAERRGGEVVARVGPSYARAALGQHVREPLPDARLGALTTGTRNGLVVVGSHVALTTRQLHHLVEQQQPLVLEINVPTILSGSDHGHLEAIVARAEEVLPSRLVVLTTSRTVYTGADPEDSLIVAARISSALTTVVRQVVEAAHPRFVVAKGGITSSDVATVSLQIRRAYVRGTLLRGGVSLWEPVGDTARQTPFVVFAGNVGEDSALNEVVERLSGRHRTSGLQGPHD